MSARADGGRRPAGRPAARRRHRRAVEPGASGCLLAPAYRSPLALWLGTDPWPGALRSLVRLRSLRSAVVARQTRRARTVEALLPLSPGTGRLSLGFAALLAVGVA